MPTDSLEKGSLIMAQHAQHLAGLATPRSEPWVPIAQAFRTDLGPDRLRPRVYRLTLRPDDGAATLHGALRVAEHGGRTVAGGDLYRYPRAAGASRRGGMYAVEPGPEVPAAMSRLGRPVRALGAPVHAPGRYHAFLAVTAACLGEGGRGLTITAAEHRWMAPQGAFGGAFAMAPKLVTLELERRPRAPGYTSAYFGGTFVEDGIPRGTVALGRVPAPAELDASRPAIGT
jgi:hypothetical protein